MLSKIYLEGGDFLWIVGFTGPVDFGFTGPVDFGFTGPVDFWIHWSSGFVDSLVQWNVWGED